MVLMRYILFSLMGALVFFVVTKESHARVQLPEFSLSDKNVDFVIENNRGNYQVALSSMKNELMRDVFILQNQINIIEGLVIRQGEIQTIANNYAKIGVPFKQPPPSRSVCAEIPLNILCFSSYPDLPVNVETMAKAEELFRYRQQELLDEIIAEIMNVEVVSPNDDNVANVESIRRMDYHWADIRCKESRCSALLVTDEGNDSRFRVNVGDIVDSGKLEITNITKTNVEALRKGEKIRIKPLSISGNPLPTPTDQTANEVSQILAENLSNINDQAIPPQPVDSVDLISDSSSDEVPVLGPTGLF